MMLSPFCLFERVAGMEAEIDPAELYKCEICGLNNYKKQLYDDHMNFHNGVKPYVCPLCPNYAAHSKSTLHYHTKHTHNLTPLTAAAKAEELRTS